MNDSERRMNGCGISVVELSDVFKGDRLHLRVVPMPQNDRECEILAEWYFGKQVSLRKMSVFGGSGQYEVEQDFNSLDDRNFEAAFSKTRFSYVSNYDIHGAFWNTILGPLYCGGTARARYGQFTINGHRNQRRLMRWVNSRARKSGCSVRPSFARLAEQIRARREQEDSRCSCTHDQSEVDAAGGVSFNHEDVEK